MLSKNGFEELDAKFERQIVTAEAKTKLLYEGTQANADDKADEGPSPHIALMAEVCNLIRCV